MPYITVGSILPPAQTREVLTMEGFVPTFDIGNTHQGYGWGGAAAGAFAGGLVGSWFGNGWGGGWGNRGGNGNCCCASQVAEMDTLQGIQSSVNGLGLQVLQGQNSANMAMCQGFSGVVAEGNSNAASINNSLTQGFAGLNTAITSGDAGIQQTLCQGFSGLNTAIVGGTKDNALATCQSTNAITSAINDCCCSTQRLIQQESCATRELIKEVQLQQTRDQLCQARDEISALKSQNFTAGAIAGLGNQLRTETNQAVNTILTHVRAFIPTTTTTPATA